MIDLVNKDIIRELERIVGKEYVITSESEMLPYKYDASLFSGSLPEAVVLPNSTEEVSQILKLCNKNKIPIVPRGAGTSLTGGPTPVRGSIVLSLIRMNRIIEVSISDGYAFVEAGIRLGELNDYLTKNYNYFFPPEPASSVAATVGGVIANDSSGLGGVRFGSVKNWVLGLEVVLPNGKVLQLGNKTLKYRVGYDLVSLIVGSEGTLAIVTKAYLKIWPRPGKFVRFVVYFDDIKKVGKAVLQIKSAGFTPLLAEFIDKSYINILRDIRNLDAPENAECALMVDIESSESMVKKMLKVLKTLDPIEIKFSSDPEEIEELSKIRKGVASVLLHLRKKNTETKVTSDIIVPPSKLPDFIIALKKKLEEYKVTAPMLGHIGEGNIHVDIMCDTADNESVSKAVRLLEEIGRMALEYGGSVSAEHGIGLEKRDLLIEEYKYRDSEEAIELMKRIKQIFDPNNILNPGKVLKV